MVIYTCPTCNKEFKKKSHFIEHTEQKKKPCQPKAHISSQKLSKTLECSQNAENFELGCKFCGQVFSKKFNLNRHLSNYCKAKKSFDEEKDKQADQIEELKKLILEQSKKIEELEKKKTNNITINNTTTTNNTDNSVKNNINLMAHGSEDFSKIDLKTILTHLTTQDFLSIVPNLTKEIFRNKKRPEFLNFEILDLARNKSRYYDGENWITGNADDGSKKVFENVNSVILEPFEKKNIYKTIKFIEKDDELSEKAEWINWGKNFCGKLFTEDDKEYVEHKEKICDNIKNLMYSVKCSQIKNNLDDKI